MRRFLTLAAVLLLPGIASAQVAAGPTLSAVRAKGFVDCAVSPGTPGFGAPDSQGIYRGLDPDSCRAVAAAVFGDVSRARFVPVASGQRPTSVQTGAVDIVTSTFTWSHSRDTANALNFAAINFYDGQSFLVRASANIRTPRDLDGAAICATAGSTSELNVADWARANNIRYRPVVFERADEARAAYISGRCDAYSTDASQLAAVRSAMTNPAEHIVLDDRISKEPLAMAVRHGDDQWMDIVRWSFYALVEAEELGITQANVDEMLNSQIPAIRRLLGQSGDHGPMMGLDRRWAYNIIKALGNYGEIYDRHLGPNTSIGLPRGVNNLWNRGGLMYVPPIR
ncbi:amino acid ABC transporter substrate-binding protein [Roseococcus pinisoli]|uniref:Amino acid ABC transporter substrate-binding protein n=1 Tax=Roseococcus pinisoli TaxID=2835040 RepID=A0ABS5QG81_9PROT|nr:amino acid ABC transporter substrate-binding protein [Roseococcus pinisoli]MBS7812700.1 amino acid ABC transporter substrate-binding protein [Roseococcus pinisoli]